MTAPACYRRGNSNSLVTDEVTATRLLQTGVVRGGGGCRAAPVRRYCRAGRQPPRMPAVMFVTASPRPRRGLPAARGPPRGGSLQINICDISIHDSLSEY